MKLPNLKYSALCVLTLALTSLSASAFAPTISTAGLDANQSATAAALNRTVPVDDIFVSDPPLVAALTRVASTENPESIAVSSGSLDQLSPEKFANFTSVLAFNNASFEIMAMDSYLASLRNGSTGNYVGNGKIDVSGLTVNDSSIDPSLSMTHSHLLAWNPSPLADGAVSDVADSSMGGMDMKDSKDMKSMQSPAYGNPWNFFVRGNVVLAQGDSTQDVDHFDYNTSGVVLGTDYRITPSIIVGLTASFAHTDVSLDSHGSSATVDSYSPGLYASYADHGFYANVIGDYLHNAYTEQRNISFLHEDATAAPEGNEGIADLDGGYDFHFGAMTVGPLAGVQYTHLSVNGYAEQGSLADLTVLGDDSDSLRGRVGAHFAYSTHFGSICVSPFVLAAYQHEFLDQSRGITSSFDAGGGDFNVYTPNPSRDSALVSTGVNADLSRTITVFVDYLAQPGQSNYFGQSVQAGAKISF